MINDLKECSKPLQWPVTVYSISFGKRIMVVCAKLVSFIDCGNHTFDIHSCEFKTNPCYDTTTLHDVFEEYLLIETNNEYITLSARTTEPTTHVVSRTFKCSYLCSYPRSFHRYECINNTRCTCFAWSMYLSLLQSWCWRVRSC